MSRLGGRLSTPDGRADGPILIVGGGIGGLAVAIALARKGFRCRVLERRAGKEENSGAGIQLGPNATQALRRLGLEDRIEHEARPATLCIRDGRTGRDIQRFPLGEWIEARHGAPYITMHRGDLYRALLDRLAHVPLVDVSSSFDVAEVDSAGSRPKVRSRNGEMVEGAALIAADGLWSKTRNALFPATTHETAPTGRVASRAVISAGQAPRVDRTSIGLWLGPGFHVVTYPVRAGREIAFVAVTSGKSGGSDWDGPADVAGLSAIRSRAAPPLAVALDAVETWKSWRLHDAAPFPRWSRGHATLLGDAAHPVAPHFAQGGALALEDALVLADCLDRNGRDVTQAFAAYEAARRVRSGRVQAASRRNGWAYQLSGLPRSGRDAYLRARSGEAHMAAFDWLYGWRPPD